MRERTDPTPGVRGYRLCSTASPCETTFPTTSSTSMLARSLRHDEGGKLKDAELKAVAEKVGIDGELLSKEVWSGRPLATLEQEHRYRYRVGTCSGAHLHSGRERSLHPFHGTQPRRRSPSGHRFAGVGPPQRVQAHQHSPLTRGERHDGRRLRLLHIGPNTRCLPVSLATLPGQPALSPGRSVGPPLESSVVAQGLFPAKAGDVPEKGQVDLF